MNQEYTNSVVLEPKGSHHY